MRIVTCKQNAQNVLSLRARNCVKLVLNKGCSVLQLVDTTNDIGRAENRHGTESQKKWLFFRCFMCYAKWAVISGTVYRNVMAQLRLS